MKFAKLKAFVSFLFLLVLAAGAHPDNKVEQALTKERVEQVLRQYILEQGPWKPERLEVRVLTFKPVRLQTELVEWRVLKPAKGVTPGLQTFLLAAEVAGKEEAQVWVRVEIKIFDHVVVSSRPLAHHELIADEDVRLERREITSVSPRPLTAIWDAVRKLATRAIEVNEILTPSMVDLPRVMRRGSSIIMVYETNQLRVETPGQAEEGGRVGDIIQVKNGSSGKLLRGVILDSRTVRVN